ncbi:MAG TPA: hypothetical protein PLC42_03495 [Parachlamydiaceae bacterium]|nr:hypothetical protein [Parachlamydiaceae bacterium]
MSRLVVTKRKAEIISNGIFLMALGILFWTNSWWPGILLAIWGCLGARQYLTGRYWDFAITSIILIGLFVVSFFNITLSVLIPVLFVVGGIYIIFREYFIAEEVENDDKEPDAK